VTNLIIEVGKTLATLKLRELKSFKTIQLVIMKLSTTTISGKRAKYFTHKSGKCKTDVKHTRSIRNTEELREGRTD
jgi:hypothetical protein